MGREKFKPRTRVHESWNMNNSGDDSLPWYKRLFS